MVKSIKGCIVIDSTKVTEQDTWLKLENWLNCVSTFLSGAHYKLFFVMMLACLASCAQVAQTQGAQPNGNGGGGGGGLTVIPEISVSSSGTPSSYGSNITLTAYVDPALCAPNAIATFYNNGSTIGSSHFSSNGSVGTATLTISSLAVGTQYLTANFGGNIVGTTTCDARTSPVFTQVVNQATPTVSAWPTAGSITYGQTLASSTLTGGTASVGGTFGWTTSSTSPGAGTPSYSVTFTPSNTTDYGSVTGQVSLTVNKAALKVTANSASRLYGVANPAFTASYSGFVNGDTSGVLSGSPSLTTTATASSSMGAYTITAAVGTLSATNYTFSYANGTLTVGKVMLTVVANSTSRSYGAANPTFNPSYSGFVNGDTSSVLSGSPSLTTTATFSSSLGAYTITAAAGTLSATNYTFSYVNGTLTVNQATPVITWATPYDVTDGTVLTSEAQLNATANVPGTFVYTPPPGTVMSATSSQTLSTTFTPTDSTDYTTTTTSVTLKVRSGASPDTGTVTLTVNGVTTATYSYGAADTPSTVAEGLANHASKSLVTVVAADNALYITANPSASATNYSFTLSASNTNHTLYPYPSFVPQPISGQLEGSSTAAATVGLVYKYGATYDPVGNLASYTDSYTDPVTGGTDSVMGVWNYTYDTLNRLATASSNQPGNPYPNYCWTYDSFGNRTTQMSANVAFVSGQGGGNACSTTGSLGPASWANQSTANNNQIANTGQTPGGIPYDASGNTLNDGVNQYLYDGEGRICAVASTPVPGYTAMTGYLYDADGTRVAKGSIANWSCNPAVNGFQTTNDYILGPGGEQMTEMGVGGATSSGTTSGPVWQHANVWAGALIATYDNVGLHFYFNDPLGTRRAQTDYQGVQEQLCSSLPFGDALNCFTPPNSNGTDYTASLAAPTEHHFTGKERDAESGNDYFGARYYASAMGRFMSPDWSAKEEPVPYATMDDPQSLNLYSYVRNNPLSRVDADGHCAEDLCIAEGLIVLGVGLEAAREAYNMTPDGQRSLNNLANAFGASFSSNISSAKNAITGVFSKETAPPNPAGQKGAPDHEAAVKEEADKARAAAGPGETVLEGKKIQGHDSTRRPDVQIVGADGKAHTVVEVERRPNHARHKTRQAEYDNLGVKHRTRPLPPKTQGQN